MAVTLDPELGGEEHGRSRDRGVTMQVEKILRTKGSGVETIAPGSPVSFAAMRMAAQRIGCLVVTEDERTVLGLVTERDLVRALAHHGPAATTMRVREVMSIGVPTCSLDDDIALLMSTMTIRRYRHVPVLRDGTLVGIVSIGDVVKQRLEDLELETNVLRDAYRANH
jgi:CBS domain-containing protein